MFDWFIDGPGGWMMGAITVVSVVGCFLLLFVGLPVAIWFSLTQTCSKWTEPYYHPPTYVMSGKVLVPVAGGTWSDCVEYKHK
jgi:hypothetical protein